MNPETKIAELYGELPTAPTPQAAYITTAQHNGIVHCSGQGPVINGKQMFTGRLGETVSIQDGYEAAKLCGINLLAQLKKQVGSLDKVKRILNAHVYVASSVDFFQQSQVANGFSDLMVAVFGDKGKHTRCALGVSVLPGNIPVEAELIAEVEEEG